MKYKWEDFKDFFRDIYIEIRVFFDSLKRCYDYLPVIWKDRDWDYAYLFQLMEYKIKRMMACHEKDKFHENHYRYVRQMRVCLFLLDRLQKLEYSDKLSEAYSAKWDKLRLIETDARGYSERKYKNDTPEAQAERRAATIAMWNLEEKCYQSDLKRFWRIFTRHHRRWWT